MSVKRWLRENVRVRGHRRLCRSALGAAVEKVLEAQITAGGGRFRGIRFITATHPDQAAWGSPVLRPAAC